MHNGYDPKYSRSAEKIRDRARFLHMLRKTDIALSTGFPNGDVFARRLSRRCERLVLVDRDSSVLRGIYGSRRIVPVIGDVFEAFGWLRPTVWWLDLMSNLSWRGLDTLRDTPSWWGGMLTFSSEHRSKHHHDLVVNPVAEFRRFGWNAELVNEYIRGRSLHYRTYYLES